MGERRHTRFIWYKISRSIKISLLNSKIGGSSSISSDHRHEAGVFVMLESPFRAFKKIIYGSATLGLLHFVTLVKISPILSGRTLIRSGVRQ